MSELNAEQKEYYIDIADKHATFLAEKVFKPAFIIAFVHGVKHGRKDMEKELNALNALKPIITFGKEPVQKKCKRKK